MPNASKCRPTSRTLTHGRRRSATRIASVCPGDARVARRGQAARQVDDSVPVRHSAYHVLDHTWEMEDRDLSGRRRPLAQPPSSGRGSRQLIRSDIGSPSWPACARLSPSHAVGALLDLDRAARRNVAPAAEIGRPDLLVDLHVAADAHARRDDGALADDGDARVQPRPAPGGWASRSRSPCPRWRWVRRTLPCR